MSFQARPAEIAEEVLQLFAYSRKSELDEFSINRYIQKLRLIINHRCLTAREYEALGMLYFAQKKYKLFIETLEEGLKQYPNSIEILSNYHIGLFSLTQLRLADLKFDLYDQWFSHPANTEKKSLPISSGTSVSHVLEKDLEFEKQMRIDITLHHDKTFDISSGPFHSTVNYDAMKKLNFDFSEIIIADFLNRLACGKVSKDEVAYLKEILGNANFNYIEHLAFADPSEETLKAIESDELDNEFDTVDDLFSSLYSD